MAMKGTGGVDSGALTIRWLKECSPIMRAAAARLYEVSFPASERDDTEDIFSDNADSGLMVLVGIDGDEVCCICVALHLTLPCLYLEYFAVDPARRGRGLGSRFLQACLPRLLTAEDEGTVLEVERPDADPKDTYRSVRMEFWRKNGAAIIMDRFVAPRLDGQDGVEELTLLWIPRSRERPAGARSVAVACQVLSEGYRLGPDEVRRLIERSA